MVEIIPIKPLINALMSIVSLVSVVYSVNYLYIERYSIVRGTRHYGIHYKWPQVILMDDIVERFETEVKRGMMQVAIMCLLEQERYGYDIIKCLKEGGLGVEEGTLYPILRRLEDEKLLSSRWETTGPRPRKYYVITACGKEVRGKLLSSLRAFSTAIQTLGRQAEGGI